jgi:competence protein ComEA
VSAFAILAVGAGGYWLLRAPPTPIENALPYAQPSALTSVPMTSAIGSNIDPTVASSVSTTVPPTSIIVYVAGAVFAPGVYRLARDARVQQAIEAAGGTVADAVVDVMNLAAFVHDGDRIYVPHVGQQVPEVIGATTSSGGSPSVTGQGGAEPTGPLDLNRATPEQLDALPGVGPATAAAIVRYRDQSGPFSVVNDLLKVPGIGPSKVDAIRALVKV